MSSVAITKGLIGALTIASAFIACRDSTLEVDGYKCADLVRANVYYGRSEADRLAEIRKYPLEKQYAVFICARQYIRPPVWAEAEPLAERGEEAANLLETKLRSPQDDRTIRDIVALIDEMDATGKYSAAENESLIQALESAISGMRDERSKQQSRERLQRIRKQQREGAPEQ